MARILIINRFYYPEMTGGVEIVVEKLSEFARKQGHQIAILTWSETPGTEIIDGITVIRLKRVRKKIAFIADIGKWIGTFPTLWKAIKQADMLHLYNVHTIPNYAAILAIAGLQKKRIVQEVPDPYLFMLFDNTKLFFSRSVLLPFFRGIYFSCVSEYMKKQLCSRGIDPTRTIISRPFLRMNVKKTNKKKVKNTVLFVGQVVEHKGVHVLMNTIPLLKDKHPKLHVTFVGGGDAEEEIRQLARTLNIQKNVTITGYIPRNKIQQYYDQNSFMVFPSLWEEPLAITTFEALEQGLPVICFPTGGTTEIVKHGYNGIVVQEKTPEKLARAMEKLLSNPRLIATYSKNAKKTTDELSFESEKKKVTTLYEKLARKNEEP